MSHDLEERVYCPDGCSPDDDDAPSFAVRVVFQGRGKWSVHRSGHRRIQPSSTGKRLVAPARLNELAHCRHRPSRGTGKGPPAGADPVDGPSP